MNLKITGVGAYRPVDIKPNAAFHAHTFLRSSGEPFEKTGPEIVRKFEDITDIAERRYAVPQVLTSDMATVAARHALDDAGLDPELLDGIILAHNFGDIAAGSGATDQVPNLAARVKGKLGIRNPHCPAFDILFGCPGWLQGLVQANYMLRAGDARHVLVIGAETLSRVVDVQDVDSMLFADGAGAAVLSATEADGGILTHATVSHCLEGMEYIQMGEAYGNGAEKEALFMKMNGKQVFRYAYEQVPALIMRCLNQAGVGVNEVDYFLIHQANGKMLKRIAERIFALSGEEDVPWARFPMNIQTMGNNSVATIPTLLDHLQRDPDIDPRLFRPGWLLAFASVGAGMHANVLLYRHPEAP